MFKFDLEKKTEEYLIKKIFINNILWSHRMNHLAIISKIFKNILRMIRKFRILFVQYHSYSKINY